MFCKKALNFILKTYFISLSFWKKKFKNSIFPVKYLLHPLPICQNQILVPKAIQNCPFGCGWTVQDWLSHVLAEVDPDRLVALQLLGSLETPAAVHISRSLSGCASSTTETSVNLKKFYFSVSTFVYLVKWKLVRLNGRAGESGTTSTIRPY